MCTMRESACGLVLALACLAPAPAAAADSFGRDKLLHFGVSAGLTLAGFAALRALELPPDRALPLAIVGALAVGLAKEALDAAVRGGFSPADLAWDWLGIVSAGCIAGLVTRWLWPPEPSRAVRAPPRATSF